MLTRRAHAPCLSATHARTTARSVLDFWARGSGLTAISLYFKDSASGSVTSDVRFTRADLLDDETISVLSADDDGWLHIRVNIAKLRAGNASAPATTKTAAASASASCGPGAAAAAASAASFDRIVFADVSGMGFRLQLDDVTLLLSPELASAFSAASFTFPTSPSGLLPVFGSDLTSVRARVAAATG